MRITPIKIEQLHQAKDIICSIGVSKEAIDILSKKALSIAFMIEGLNSWEANIIKQHLLSLGADSAINRDAILKNMKLNTCIFANVNQLEKLCYKLRYQPFKLKEVSETILKYIENYYKKEFVFKANKKELRINQPIICGIINLTTDSFSGDGLLTTSTQLDIKTVALKKVEKMIKSGAKIIDLGGESSRPFSKPITEKEEINRVIPVLNAIRKEFKDILISIDTYKYKVAKIASEEGADIINDITALRKNPKIISLIKKYKLGCIIMHMKGSPKTMQLNPKYEDVTGEIFDFMNKRLEFCYSNNIDREQILIDPGIGFGKKLEDNIKIIKELYKFRVFGLPIFLGISRKSFIGKILNLDVKDRLLGTIACSVIALLNGAKILRTHDVEETSQAIKLFSTICN